MLETTARVRYTCGLNRSAVLGYYERGKKMSGQGKWKGYSVLANRYGKLPNSYKVEFVSGFQQPYVDGRPQQVPSFPRVIVEISGEETKFQWEFYPPTNQFSLEEFEAAAKKAVGDLLELEQKS
jgi:hypothetical protein